MAPTAKNTEGLKVSAQGEREIVMTRVFNAPRRFVFEALTKPELVKRWLLGPDGWTLPVCEIDARPGGKYRYVWRHEKGQEMGAGGVFREVVAPEKIVLTEQFDEPWYPGESVITTTLEEENGQTKFRATMLYESREARDAVLASPMESGVAVSYDRLEEVVGEMRR